MLQWRLSGELDLYVEYIYISSSSCSPVFRPLEGGLYCSSIYEVNKVPFDFLMHFFNLSFCTTCLWRRASEHLETCLFQNGMHRILTIFHSSSFRSFRFVTEYAFYPPQGGGRGLTNWLPFILI